jgi:dolichol kinase
MLRIFFTLVAVFIALMINEFLWRKHKIKNEFARKSIHISVAVFVAFWPYYLSYLYIEYIAIAFIIVILISRRYRLFQSIDEVKRSTLGELFFPLGILAAALLAPQKEVFTIALLCVGLADGLAALVGQRYGRSNRYKIFKGFKSIAGSLTVFIVSLIILLLTNYFGSMHLAIISFIVLPLDVALVEAFAPIGSDDFLIPITALAILSLL